MAKRGRKIVDYKKMRAQIKDGDVLLFKGTSLVSRFIQWASYSEYSHTGIAVRWNNRLMVLDSLFGGVKVQPLSLEIKKYKGDVEWYTSKKSISKKDRMRMIKFAELELGKEYGYFFVFWNLLRRRLFQFTGDDTSDILKPTEKTFCSFYVAQMYNMIGLDLTKHKEDCYMSPKDIARSPILKFKGVLKKYKAPPKRAKKRKR